MPDTPNLLRIIAILMLLSPLFCGGCFNVEGRQQEIKSEIEKSGGLKDLKQDCLRFIGKSIDEVLQANLEPDHYPSGSYPKKIGKKSAEFLIDSQTRKITAVKYEWGGIDLHFGIIIGSLEDIENNPSVMHRWLSRQWEENVFFFDQVNPDFYNARRHP